MIESTSRVHLRLAPAPSLDRRPQILESILFAVFAICVGVHDLAFGQEVHYDASELTSRPEQAASNKQQELEALISKSDQAGTAGQWDQLLNLSSQILALEPSHLGALHTRELALRKLNRFADAAEAARRLAKLAPANTEVETSLCWDLILAERSSEARTQCEHVESLEPYDVSNPINLGHIYLLKGDRDNAWYWYERSIPLIDGPVKLESILEDFSLFELRGWQPALAREAQGWFARRTEPWFRLSGSYASLNQLVFDLTTQGRFSEAIEPERRALKISEEQFGPAAPETATQLGRLAELQRNNGEVGSSMPLLNRALEIFMNERLEGAGIGIALNNLGLFYQEAGDFPKALDYFQRASVIVAKISSPDSVLTSKSLNNQAVVLDLMGQSGEALDIYEHSLAINENIFGRDSFESTNTIENMAKCLINLDSFDKALNLNQRALDIIIRSRGADSIEAAEALSTRALIFNRMGQFSSALPLVRRALLIDEARLGEYHRASISALNQMGDTELGLGVYVML